jgi:hypothetical protein
MVFFREASLIKYGDETISTSIGTPGSVEFNFEEIWDKWKATDRDPRLLHFFHVHPDGFTEPSFQDEICIKGFNVAFGYPIVFCIITFGVEASMKSFQFINGRWFDAQRCVHLTLTNYYWLKNSSSTHYPAHQEGE